MRRARDGGFTLIELMVGLVVASIAVGFIFRIYATSSVAYRTQSQLAETMQSLRTAKQVITKRLRNAGFGTATGAATLATSGTTATSTAGVYLFQPIRVVNSSTGPDELYLTYADTTCQAQVTKCTSGCPNTSAVTKVDSTSCFADNDIAIAVRVGPPNQGQSCVLQITSVLTSAGKLQHNPSSIYNDPGNAQCTNVKQDSGGANIFSDGNTVFMKFKSEGYRIKSNDARGVLQYSATGGMVNDWQDIAFGFVDLQLAVERATTTAVTTLSTNVTVTTTAYDWLSGDNMTTFAPGSTTTTTATTKTVVTTAFAEMRLNLLARTIAEVSGPGTATTPSMLGSPAATNSVGDHGSVSISGVTNTSSPYYGNYLYRMVSTEVDLRNLGVGQVSP